MKVQYQRSDAWLLLATIYASQSGDSTIQRIVAMGDRINHAIFTDEELEGGILRLTSGGLVRERDGSFVLARKVIRAYSQTTSPRRGIAKELKDIEKFLGVDH